MIDLDFIMQKENQMYKALKDEKIIAINEIKNFPCLICDDVVEDIEHTCEDYKQYNGEYLLKEDIPAPTEEEQRQKREQAYTQEVDHITCHINRLKDEEQTPEIQEEIAKLQAERETKVNEIKQKYPYPKEV